LTFARAKVRRGVRTSRLIFSIVFACLVTRGASSQSQAASVGIGVGSARYAGGATLTAAAISPALQFDSPRRSIALGGTVASLPLGVWSSQGRADIWMATPLLGGVHLGIEGIGAATTRTDSGRTAAAHGMAEILWAAQTWGLGFGAGPSGGWIANAPSVVALHTRARAWWQVGVANYAIGVEPTRFLGAWFTDASASLAVTRGTVCASLWGMGRLSSAYGSKGAGGALVQVFPTTSLAIELSAGSYLPDPYQGLPRAGYVTAGIRLFAGRRTALPVAITRRWPALLPERHGNTVVVRFRMEGAQAVAIAGDWDEWQPRALHSPGGGIWEGTLMLPSGTYHFNLLMDGSEWVVPGGVAIVTDGLGGMVGVLIVR
jgi:hypothetical protein